MKTHVVGAAIALGALLSEQVAWGMAAMEIDPTTWIRLTDRREVESLPRELVYICRRGPRVHPHAYTERAHLLSVFPHFVKSHLIGFIQGGIKMKTTTYTHRDIIDQLLNPQICEWKPSDEPNSQIGESGTAGLAVLYGRLTNSTQEQIVGFMLTERSETCGVGFESITGSQITRERVDEICKYEDSVSIENWYLLHRPGERLEYIRAVAGTREEIEALNAAAFDELFYNVIEDTTALQTLNVPQTINAAKIVVTIDHWMAAFPSGFVAVTNGFQGDVDRILNNNYGTKFDEDHQFREARGEDRPLDVHHEGETANENPIVVLNAGTNRTILKWSISEEVVACEIDQDMGLYWPVSCWGTCTKVEGYSPIELDSSEYVDGEIYFEASILGGCEEKSNIRRTKRPRELQEFGYLEEFPGLERIFK